MCLLTYFPPGVEPDIAALELGAENNPDGHGYAIVTHDGIVVGRGMDAESVIDRFQTDRRRYRGPALFHSRIATAGSTDKSNCHPFYVGDRRTVIAHNGILPRTAQPGKSDQRSDTRILADDLIATKTRKAPFDLTRRSGRRALRRWAGPGNRLVVLSADPRYRNSAYIVNAQEGEWRNKVWYSNTTYRYRYAYRSFGSMDWDQWDKDHPRANLTGMGSSYPVSQWADRDTYWYKNSAGKWTEANALTLDPERKCLTCDTEGKVFRATDLCAFCRCCNKCGNYADQCECYSRAKVGRTDATSYATIGRAAILGTPGIDQSVIDPLAECSRCGYDFQSCRCAELAEELAAERSAALVKREA
jgi:predicted glutamine amidotransferase